MDDVCPPSTVFGAFHAYRGRKQIEVWEYNGHEAGGSHDLEIVLGAFGSLLTPDGPAINGKDHDGGLAGQPENGQARHERGRAESEES
jgi:hypothetical protein